MSSNHVVDQLSGQSLDETQGYSYPETTEESKKQKSLAAEDNNAFASLNSHTNLNSHARERGSLPQRRTDSYVKVSVEVQGDSQKLSSQQTEKAKNWSSAIQKDEGESKVIFASDSDYKSSAEAYQTNKASEHVKPTESRLLSKQGKVGDSE